MLVQLQRLPALVARRREVAAAYQERLSDIELLTLPVELPDRRSVWQSYIIELDGQLSRGTVARYLRERDVQCNIGTYASHVQPLYDSSHTCPVSARVFERHISIPMHANLTEEQIDRVCGTLRAAVESSVTNTLEDSSV
jgi:dTDP-4-amino-4,6-dideoxygalactose transaminase